MAIDLKYGKVTCERGSIADDEPVVVFRAQDRILAKLLAHYYLFCLQEDCDQTHLASITRARDAVKKWQRFNRIKRPD